MRPLLLPACLAATAAFAAELKDPAAVAREWNLTVQGARVPVVEPTLAGQSDALTTTPLERIFAPETDAPRSLPSRTLPGLGPLYDAPSRPYPRRLPPEVPDNAIPWLYRGSNYWLVPLGGPPVSR